ncbi:hypothetical protein [Bdellovibrio bacteriovorus]|uniref:hypothetical protein n=1 Tax=Bdellovibrio bacteriovorus TaxID=959 RepID=UPI0035A629C7
MKAILALWVLVIALPASAASLAEGDTVYDKITGWVYYIDSIHGDKIYIHNNDEKAWPLQRKSSDLLKSIESYGRVSTGATVTYYNESTKYMETSEVTAVFENGLAFLWSTVMNKLWLKRSTRIAVAKLGVEVAEYMGVRAGDHLCVPKKLYAAKGSVKAGTQAIVSKVYDNGSAEVKLGKVLFLQYKEVLLLKDLSASCN